MTKNVSVDSFPYYIVRFKPFDDPLFGSYYACFHTT